MAIGSTFTELLGRRPLAAPAATVPAPTAPRSMPTFTHLLPGAVLAPAPPGPFAHLMPAPRIQLEPAYDPTPPAGSAAAAVLAAGELAHKPRDYGMPPPTPAAKAILNAARRRDGLPDLP